MARYLVLLTLLTLSLPASAETVHTKSPQDILDLFDRIGYTKEAWKKGVREVPKVFLTNIPERWKNDSQKMPVKIKKALFFRLAGPAILQSNTLIKTQRQKLIAEKDQLVNGTASQTQKTWLLNLAKYYRVKVESGIDRTLIDKLLVRVDEIPVSLALTQAAEESGWGTSRFAVLGNALFGQWDFSGKGIKPKNQRKELGDYGIAKFPTPQESVDSYMRNLNTHSAYAELRKLRATLKKNNKKVTGYKLATKLDKYSERGEVYVKGLHAIMRINNLAPTDEAYLWDKEIIYIKPIEK